MRCTIPAQGCCEQDTGSLGAEHVPSVREDLEIGETQVGLLLPLGFPWCHIAEALVCDSAPDKRGLSPNFSSTDLCLLLLRSCSQTLIGSSLALMAQYPI